MIINWPHWSSFFPDLFCPHLLGSVAWVAKVVDRPEMASLADEVDAKLKQAMDKL
jgi:hypothetical protein